MSKAASKEIDVKARPITQPIIGVAVIEDDPILLVGLLSILDTDASFHLIATSSSLIATGPRVDVVMLRHSGIKLPETIAKWRSVRPDLKVIVIGTGADDPTILNAIASGSQGYVDEAAPTSEFVEAINTVYRGSMWISRRIMAMVIERSAGPRSRDPQTGDFRITSREIQILEMLVGGRSNREIGNPLGIKERTVTAHVARLMHKVGVNNRVALSVHAIRHSLVSAE